MYVCCRWENYTLWCFPIYFSCVFFIFQETKINCVRLATKGMWVSLSCKTQYQKCKNCSGGTTWLQFLDKEPASLFPLLFFFFLRKIDKPEQQFPGPLHYICGLLFFFLTQGIILCGASFPSFCWQLFCPEDCSCCWQNISEKVTLTSYSICSLHDCTKQIREDLT